jgi:hypothetical protein
MAYENSKPQHILSVPLIAISRIHSTAEEISIFGKPTDYIEIVGRLIQESTTALKTEYTIQDYSAVQTVYFFKKQHEEIARPLTSFEYADNAYVRVVASLRIMQGAVNIIGLFIENIKERTQITDFYGRVLVSYIKSASFKPDVKSQIMAAVKQLTRANSSVGATITDIRQFLGPSFNEAVIEEHCSRLLSENVLAMGIDWNHYLLA